jgi:hypothetical protein
MIRRSVLTICYSVFALLLACTISPLQSDSDDGGSTLEVLAFSGAVRKSDGTSGAGIDVALKTVIVGPVVDSTLSVYHTKSDSNGKFRLYNVPDGNYLLIVADSSGLEAVSQRMKKSVDSIQDTLVTGSLVTLKGRVTTALSGPVTARVSIPGTGRWTTTDESGAYILDSVPPGSCDLHFTWGITVNIVPMTILGGADTLIVRDVLLQPDTSAGAEIYSFFTHSLTNSYAVRPTIFPPSLDSSLYGDADFAGISYELPDESGYTPFSPQPLSALFLTRLKNDGSLIPEDRNAVAFMTSNGISVVARRDTEFTVSNVERNYSFIYISFHSLSANVGSLLHPAPLPIIVCEPNLYASMGMAPESKSGYLQSGSLTCGVEMDVVAPGDPLAAGYTGVIAPMHYNGHSGYSYAGDTAKIVLSYCDDTQRAWLFYYDTGDYLYGGDRAMGKRIGLGASYAFWNNPTRMGEDIMNAILAWVKK